MALCCHHRCCWRQLAGTAWLSQQGFSPTDVHLIAKMSSWAVCGVRVPKDDHRERIETGMCEDRDGRTCTHSSYSTADTTACDRELNPEPVATSKASSDLPHNSHVHQVTTRSNRTVTIATSSPYHPHPNKESRTVATATGTSSSSYHPHPREVMGLKCKRLLDLARLHYLSERNMEGKLVYFVSPDTSLENVLLIATPVCV